MTNIRPVGSADARVSINTEIGRDIAETRNGTWDALQAIYLVIAGLAIAEAITLAFTNTDGTFGGAVVFHTSGGPLLVAFLVTIVRFAHGSVLHLTELNDQRKWRLNMCGLLLQALIFFVAALAVRQTTDFLVSLLAILLTNSLLWLIALRFFEKDHPPPAFKQWISSTSCLASFSERVSQAGSGGWARLGSTVSRSQSWRQR